MKKIQSILTSLLLTQISCTSTSLKYIETPKQYKTQPKTELQKKDSAPLTLPEPKLHSKNTPKPNQQPKAIQSSSAVLVLIQESEDNRKNGELDSATSTLERAIRIQPRNPRLWHRLAIIRLEQQQPGLAEDLAKKSNLLAKGDSELSRKNWAIIAEARRRKGDMEGAESADQKAGK